MNKKFYTAPNVDIVELQGEVVLTNASGEGGDNVINDGGVSGPTAGIENGTIGTVGDNRNFDSGAYFDVWEDE